MSSPVLTASHRDRAGTSLVAFERFVRIDHVTVFRLAACMLGDAEKAEDVVEDLFGELWCRKDQALSTAELLARTEPGFGLESDRTRVASSTFLKP